MENEHDAADQKTSRRVPWNKGKLIGAKPPLRPSHVWSIRTKLQVGDKFLSPILKSPTSASGRGRVKTRIVTPESAIGAVGTISLMPGSL